MAISGRNVLIVTPTPTFAESVQRWLEDAGYTPSVAATFPVAKGCLRTAPALLLTEVRLGEYNGLQLAMYAQVEGIPTIVIGDADNVVKTQSGQFGATFVDRADASRENMLSHVERLISESPRKSRRMNFRSVQHRLMASDSPRSFTPVRRLSKH